MTSKCGASRSGVFERRAERKDKELRMRAHKNDRRRAVCAQRAAAAAEACEHIGALRARIEPGRPKGAAK